MDVINIPPLVHFAARILSGLQNSIQTTLCLLCNFFPTCSFSSIPAFSSLTAGRMVGEGSGIDDKLYGGEFALLRILLGDFHQVK